MKKSSAPHKPRTRRTKRPERTVLAWHFLDSSRRLRYADGREVHAGETLTVDVKPTLCERGLHASKNILHALNYAPGPVICRVAVSGSLVLGSDKLAGKSRRCVWMLDAEKVLHEFACWCAERALKQAGVTDERCWAAIAAKRAWLRGEISYEQLAAAQAAAYAARDAAAADAAADAADAAAYAARAAADAAAVAVRAAAAAAAADAARATTQKAERRAQARKLIQMLNQAREAETEKERTLP